MKKGFTLIELLIVMGIIAILASMSIFALQGAREQGRDAKRKADIEVIRSALELYKADCNVYPASIPNPNPNPPAKLQGNCTGTTNTYLSRIPNDPSGATMPYKYYPGSGNLTYTICSTLEDSSATTAPSPCSSCSGGTCKYSVTSP